MRVLVFGGSGMLGHKLAQNWRGKFDTFTTIRHEFDRFERFGVLDKNRTFEHVQAESIEQVSSIARQIKPHVLVNAIGVVKQVPDSGDVIRTLQINSLFPHQLAKIAKEIGARLISISTDCVFDGMKGNYSEDDFPNARDLYGKSKNLGEVTDGNCLTLRTSIIGRELLTGHSLLEWFLSNAGQKVEGFVNAIYSGFPTLEMADILADVIVKHSELKGLYHLSSEPINKYELLRLINKYFLANAAVEPSTDFAIDRSLNSARFRRDTGFTPKSWKTMIKDMAADNAAYEV